MNEDYSAYKQMLLSLLYISRRWVYYWGVRIAWHRSYLRSLSSRPFNSGTGAHLSLSPALLQLRRLVFLSEQFVRFREYIQLDTSRLAHLCYNRDESGRLPLHAEQLHLWLQRSCWNIFGSLPHFRFSFRVWPAVKTSRAIYEIYILIFRARCSGKGSCDDRSQFSIDKVTATGSGCDAWQILSAWLSRLEMDIIVRDIREGLLAGVE